MEAQGKEEAAKYCRYLPIKIGDITCSALIDSGNLWRNAISVGLLRKLGLSEADLRPAETSTIATAKQGANLKVLGELKKAIYINIGGLQTRFKTRPVVIEDLSMAANISGPFLKRHGMDQIHSEDCLRINGHDVPLFSTPNRDRAEKAEVVTSAVYLQGKATIPARGVAYVQLRVPAVEKGIMTAGPGLVEGSEIFMKRTDAHPWTGTLATCDKDGNLIAGVMNTLDEEIEIAAGTKYGDFTKTCTVGSEEP